MDDVQRDFLEGPDCIDRMYRDAAMNIWNHKDLTFIDWRQSEPEQSFFEVNSYIIYDIHLLPSWLI